MIAARILAVLAAIFLVGAFALATLMLPDISLGQAVLGLHLGWLQQIHDMAKAWGMPWVWDDMVLPMLVRPAWLIPTGLGLICIGCAASANSHSKATRSHRRRS